MQNQLAQQRLPQLPAALGRLVLWEQTREWARFFLNRMRGERDQGSGVRQLPEAHPLPPSSLLADQAIFVTSPGELREAVENHPASFVFAEVTVVDFRELLGQIPRFRRTMPQFRLAIVCFELPGLPVDESHLLDILFREAGATAVLATRRDLLAMIPAVLRHFANLPQQETGWREYIEQQLPWRNTDY